MSEQIKLERLDEGIKYYKRSADSSWRKFTALKMLQILIGATIPICSLIVPLVTGDGYQLAAIINGILGTAIAAIESYLQLGQTERNWYRWRSTQQALQREKSLFLQNAGPYYAGTEPKPSNVILAERTEQIISEEHLEWRAGVHQTTKVDVKPKESSDKGRLEHPTALPP